MLRPPQRHVGGKVGYGLSANWAKLRSSSAGKYVKSRLLNTSAVVANEAEVRRQAEKLNEALLGVSRDSALVFMAVPEFQAVICDSVVDPELYVRTVDRVLSGLKRVLLVKESPEEQVVLYD
jgi:hypothetical protein